MRETSQPIRITILALAIGTTLAIEGSPMWADETPASGPVPNVNSETPRRLAKWKQLRAENPEAFQRLAAEHKTAIKERLKALKQKHPETFEAVKQRHQEHRFNQLKRLRREEPEKFREIMRQRRERMEQWRAENPERFEKFLADHPRLAKGVRHSPPPRRPDDRLQDRRDRYEDRWDQREDIRDRNDDFRDRQLKGKRSLQGNLSGPDRRGRR